MNALARQSSVIPSDATDLTLSARHLGDALRAVSHALVSDAPGNHDATQRFLELDFSAGPHRFARTWAITAASSHRVARFNPDGVALWAPAFPHVVPLPSWLADWASKASDSTLITFATTADGWELRLGDDGTFRSEKKPINLWTQTLRTHWIPSPDERRAAWLPLSLARHALGALEAHKDRTVPAQFRIMGAEWSVSAEPSPEAVDLDPNYVRDAVRHVMRDARESREPTSTRRLASTRIHAERGTEDHAVAFVGHRLASIVMPRKKT